MLFFRKGFLMHKSKLGPLRRSCTVFATHMQLTKVSSQIEKDWVEPGVSFSGNGKMEPEVAKIIAEINTDLFVIDCLPNMNEKLVEYRNTHCFKLNL